MDTLSQNLKTLTPTKNTAPRFAILISTKNRCRDLEITLKSLSAFLDKENISCTVYDDGSADGTSHMIKTQYPEVTVLRNEISKGYLFCRNQMLNASNADYAISLDDDANFLSADALGTISAWFETHPECGLIAFRIFWGLDLPKNETDLSEPQRVRGFVGCGHVWKMTAWKAIPDYPEWFGFYGEEEFAAQHLFLKRLEVHYVPSILVHHRVDMKGRQKDSSYKIRMRRSLASGWYLFYLFLPPEKIARKMASSITAKIKLAFRERTIVPIRLLFQATADLIAKTPFLIRERSAFSRSQYKEFQQIPGTKVYWNPNGDDI
ncbi:glycosyltransferase family 2 protein [Flavobacterium silvaticum]|uniref:Glycosyltransferase family 2 protein n=1 Tax=Flavobacterium silvaticum TaxID=1852020 RepID=A0A972JHQ7_9FLAO|nr:glycosyltransferase family A protein [Flavobacterium silvaticum]NMH29486.1 glycosyltransferase family 2 protein [Flavobacterium silvaticum]